MNNEKNPKERAEFKRNAFNHEKKFGSKQFSNSMEWIFRNKKIGKKVGKFFSGYLKKVLFFAKGSSIDLHPANISDYATDFAVNEINFSMRRTLKLKNKKGITGLGTQIFNGVLNSLGLYVEDRIVKFGGHRIKVPIQFPLVGESKIRGNFNYNTQRKRVSIGCNLKLAKLGMIEVRTGDVKDPHKNTTFTINSKPYKDTNINLKIGIRAGKPSGGVTMNARF
jgi:hypothetical protein